MLMIKKNGRRNSCTLPHRNLQTQQPTQTRCRCARDDIGWSTAGERSSKSKIDASQTHATTSATTATATTTSVKTKTASTRASMAKPRQLASLSKEATEAAKSSTKNLGVTTNRPAPREAIYAGLTSISAFNKHQVASIYQTMSRRT